jgi:hypothetical protein
VSGDGNGWARCALGHRHWGRYGAAGVLITDGARVMLQHRATLAGEEQAGRPEPAPVPVALGAVHPAVAVTHDEVPTPCSPEVDVGPPGRLSAEGRSRRQMWDRGPWIGPTPLTTVPGRVANRREPARPGSDASGRILMRVKRAIAGEVDD